MKVGIIGGGGIVGSSAGFALQLGGVVHEIVIVDANADLADGQALDMLHGTAAIADQVIRAGGYDALADADVICITAGLRRKPDESRLALINRNVELFRSILAAIQAHGLKADATVLVVSNPVDILTAKPAPVFFLIISAPEVLARWKISSPTLGEKPGYFSSGSPATLALLQTGTMLSPCSPRISACSCVAGAASRSASRLRNRSVSSSVPRPITRPAGSPSSCSAR